MITTVLILLEAIFVLVWMDINWNQIITLVQVMIIQLILSLFYYHHGFPSLLFNMYVHIIKVAISHELENF